MTPARGRLSRDPRHGGSRRSTHYTHTYTHQQRCGRRWRLTGTNTAAALPCEERCGVYLDCPPDRSRCSDKEGASLSGLHGHASGRFVMSGVGWNRWERICQFLCRGFVDMALAGASRYYCLESRTLLRAASDVAMAWRPRAMRCDMSCQSQRVWSRWARHCPVGGVVMLTES